VESTRQTGDWLTPYPDIAPRGSNSESGYLFPYYPDSDIVQFVEAAESTCDETGTPCNVAVEAPSGAQGEQCQVGFGIDLGNGPCTAAELAMPPETKDEQVQQVVTHLISAGNSIDGYLPSSRFFTQYELDTLADFAYNLGPNAFPISNLRRYIMAGDTSPAQIKAGFDGWVNLSRRNAEADMFSYGVYENYNHNPVIRMPA
jgi:GH24 family phage-related lysozyme (muramidase)